jgi:hypothetical protein
MDWSETTQAVSSFVTAIAALVAVLFTVRGQMKTHAKVDLMQETLQNGGTNGTQGEP